MQPGLGNRIIGQQITFKVFGITRANVQFATQGLELGDGHFFLDRLDIEVAAFIGLADEVGIRFAGFRFGEVMQCSIKQ
ncbi:hypothetical protein D3C78_1800620 [compost metagenome]